MELNEWVVSGGIMVVGLIAGIGLYLGNRDPSVAPYKPSIAGLFQLGRVRAGREDFEKHETKKDGSK